MKVMNTATSQLKEYILTTVCAICQEQREQHKAPIVATLSDIIRVVNAEVQAVLDELTSDGTLTKTENVNKISMFYPTNQ